MDANYPYPCMPLHDFAANTKSDTGNISSSL